MGIECICDKNPNSCLIHPKPKPVLQMQEKKSTPEIAPEDKLTLKTLEAAWLKAQLDARDARQQVEAFGAVVYEKLGITPQDWFLDMATLTLTPRKG